jgi:hypothetical protein
MTAENDLALDILHSLCLLLIIGVVLFFGTIILQNESDPFHDVEITTNTSIFSLYSDSSNSGHFILGTGSLSNQVQYIIYTPVNDSAALKMTSIPAEETLIYQDTSEDPYFSTIAIYRENSKERYGPYGPIRYELHVPPGTMIREYALN